MLAYTGMPICSKGVRFRRPCPLPICPYLCRMEEKAKRSGREQERRPPRQAAAAAAAAAAAGGRTARPRPPARVLIYSAKGRRQACAPYRQHGRQSGEAGRAERQSGRRHGRRRSKLVVNYSIIYNYYIYNTFIINTLYCHC